MALITSKGTANERSPANFFALLPSMMRERPENNVAVFDAKTVQNKVTVKTTTQAQFWIPFIIDPRKRV